MILAPLRSPWLVVAAVLGAFTSFAPLAGPLVAQLPPARVIAALGEGNFTVVIGNDTLTALTLKKRREFADSMSLITLLRGEVALRDTLIAQHRITQRRADTLISKIRAYDAVLEQQAEGYRKLAELTERLHSRGQRIAVELGGGATRNGDPALIAGLQIFRFRVWAFSQKDNMGGLIGGSLPIW